MRNKVALRSRNQEQSTIREVTQLIQSKNGINLGQGTCALPPDIRVLEAAQRAIAAGHNSYTPFDGIPQLKKAICAHAAVHNELAIHPRNVLVTGGATGAFECICKCFLEPGDEVILFEPAYQYHIRQIRERGGVPRYVPLHHPGWTFLPDELERAINPRTKLLVISNPHNPTGRVLSRKELEMIGSICRTADIIAVSDEVYEHILAEDSTHISLASVPGMFEHTLTFIFGQQDILRNRLEGRMADRAGRHCADSGAEVRRNLCLRASAFATCHSRMSGF